MTPEQYCAQKAASAGSSFTVAFKLLPEDKRSAMEVLYAYCREVDDIADEVEDPTVAGMKLAWWATELERVRTGTPTHPAGKALQVIRGRFELADADLDAILEGVRRDLHPMHLANWQELDGYCDQVAGAVGRLSARIFDRPSADTLAYATELGLALQYTNILRDVGEDARRGRVYLPESLLHQHGLTRQGILTLEDTPSLRAALREVAQRANVRYDNALAHLPVSERRGQRAGLVMGAVYRDLLRAIEESQFDVMGQRISLGPARKAWVAATAALGRLPR
jgi:phytoene synthase